MSRMATATATATEMAADVAAAPAAGAGMARAAVAWMTADDLRVLCYRQYGRISTILGLQAFARTCKPIKRIKPRAGKDKCRLYAAIACRVWRRRHAVAIRKTHMAGNRSLALRRLRGRAIISAIDTIKWIDVRGEECKR